MLRGKEENFVAVAVYADGRVWEGRRRPARGLALNRKPDFAARVAAIPRGMAVSAQALNQAADQLYLGTASGELISLSLSGDETEPEVTPVSRDRHAISSLSFLNGGYALAVGDSRGGVSVWFPRREGGEFRLRPSVSWKENLSPVRNFAASGRDRGFFSLDGAGRLRWLYSTSGDQLLEAPARTSPAVDLALGRRGDLLLLLHADGGLEFQRLDASHPEAGWSGFFRKLLYEGYDEPAFVWQSSGSDSAEPKLSLAPLIWGSLKGALYSLFFAAPLSLAAAMYLSQFARPAWRAILKPAVEVLAAVPSVVVGFLAALWLAPLLEGVLAPFAAGFRYDQRNSLVIALAMGFAVIPIIFSLAEDAISAVPPSLSAASLALGASKWQTVWRVVLPSASPGIFTAALLGFGRAVGETMIVLMATGNTPIISLSPFNGMRTLSANIAVEMPEAPVGETLYRTLFLCALILFALTLLINAAAESMRQRLRRRYGSH
jgi:phosphate transport system permease protein